MNLVDGYMPFVKCSKNAQRSNQFLECLCQPLCETIRENDQNSKMKFRPCYGKTINGTNVVLPTPEVNMPILGCSQGAAPGSNFYTAVALAVLTLTDLQNYK